MSKTYMVTGGAGFIGSNFVLYLLDRYEDVLVINVDKLTYAGNLENLKSIESDPRHIFSQTDICDKESIRKLFDAYNFDYVVNFAAESHVDRSIKTPEVFAKQMSWERYVFLKQLGRLGKVLMVAINIAGFFKYQQMRYTALYR